MSAAPEHAPLFTVLVVVGTDHHRFDRLVDWVDAWAERQRHPTRVVFQHGSAKAPRVAEGHALLPHEELQELMAGAHVLVTHGGPATICEAWRHGRLPLVVPRDPTRGEHVDGHQQRFSRRLGAQGLVHLCEEAADLERVLDRARVDPESVCRPYEGRESTVTTSVDRVRGVGEALVEGRSRGRRGGARRGRRGAGGRSRRARAGGPTGPLRGGPLPLETTHPMG